MKIQCCNCQKTISIPDNFQGKAGKCPQCGEIIEISKEQHNIQKKQKTDARILKCDICSMQVSLPENSKQASVLCPQCKNAIDISSQASQTSSRTIQSKRKKQKYLMEIL